MDPNTAPRPEDLAWSLLLLGLAMLRVPEEPIENKEDPHEKAPVHP